MAATWGRGPRGRQWDTGAGRRWHRHCGARGRRGHPATLPGCLSHSEVLTTGRAVSSTLVSAQPGSPAPLRATLRQASPPAASRARAMPRARVSGWDTPVHPVPEPPRPSPRLSPDERPSQRTRGPDSRKGLRSGSTSCGRRRRNTWACDRGPGRRGRVCACVHVCVYMCAWTCAGAGPTGQRTPGASQL